MRVSRHYDQIFKFHHYYRRHSNESRQNQSHFEIKNFKTRTIKNVQAFLSFVNFYRRFIHKYFNLTQSLTALIKQENKEKSLS